jgi:hypothetical protein
MLIGLTGRVCAGKDTAAAILCSGGEWASIAFADALRLEIAAAWCIDVRTLTDRRTKDSTTPVLRAGGSTSALWHAWAQTQGHCLTTPRSPRWVMQQWGSYRRATDPGYWVGHVTYWVQYQRQQADRAGRPCNLVVTDCRLPIEAEALRALGGHIVRIHRPGAHVLPDEVRRHESEEHHQSLPVDDEVTNDASQLALAAELLRLVQRLQRKEARPA